MVFVITYWKSCLLKFSLYLARDACVMKISKILCQLFHDSEWWFLCVNDNLKIVPELQIISGNDGISSIFVSCQKPGNKSLHTPREFQLIKTQNLVICALNLRKLKSFPFFFLWGRTHFCAEVLMPWIVSQSHIAIPILFWEIHKNNEHRLDNAIKSSKSDLRHRKGQVWSEWLN